MGETSRGKWCRTYDPKEKTDPRKEGGALIKEHSRQRLVCKNAWRKASATTGALVLLECRVQGRRMNASLVAVELDSC